MMRLSSDIEKIKALKEELTAIKGFQFAMVHSDWVVVYLDKARFKEYFDTDSKTYQINGVIFQGQ